jgi:hypothetical protein
VVGCEGGAIGRKLPDEYRQIIFDHSRLENRRGEVVPSGPVQSIYGVPSIARWAPASALHAAILRSPSQSVRNPTTWFQLGLIGDAGSEIANGLGAFLCVARFKPGSGQAFSLEVVSRAGRRDYWVNGSCGSLICIFLDELQKFVLQASVQACGGVALRRQMKTLFHSWKTG